MHLRRSRRDSVRSVRSVRENSLPPQLQGTAVGVPSTPKTSTTQAYAFLSSPPAASSQPQSQPQSQLQPPRSRSPPHGLKGLGRRMSSSKPVRILKTFASRTSLRGHGRRTSASSVNSLGSQLELGVGEPEHGREASEEDYGKEVVKSVLSESVPVAEPEALEEVKGGAVATEEAKQVVEPAGSEHEAEVRQEQSQPEQAIAQPEQVQKQELEAPVEQTKADSEEAAVPVVEDVVEPMTDDVKDEEYVATDVEQADSEVAGPDSREERGETHVDATSLSSSATNVDLIAIPPTDTDADADGFVQVKQDKMEQEHADINPFLVDDPEDPLSEPEAEAEREAATASPGADTPVAQSLVLSAQLENVDTTTPSPPPVPAPVVDEKQPESAPAPSPPEKPLPAPSEGTPSSASSSTEDEAPELHTPALTVTSLFLPVPHTDPLSALLTKYIPEPHLRPQRDTSGEWTHTDFHTLVMTNNWRALARMARDRIIASNPRDVELILNLWYIRLSSLARLRLFNQTSAECENLFSVLATIEPPAARAYILRSVLPFELEVLRARCAYWASDHVGYLDDVAALLRRCRVRARQARDPAEHAMWRERGARMALIVASQLVEMKDYTAAASLLEPLCTTGSSPPSPTLRSALARIYLQGGLLEPAFSHFDAVEADPEAERALKATNAVVRAAVLGEWEKAAEHARGLVEGESEDVVAANNYAVALLGQGKVKEGIQVLETTLQASPSATTTTEPYLFNLSTMYELRAALTAHRKRDLLIEVAKWSGDGLRTTCLKMNA